MSPVVVNDALTGKPVAVMKDDPEGRYVHWTDTIATPAPVTVSEEMVTKAWAVYYGKRNGRSGCSQYDAMRAALEVYESARGAKP